MKSGSIQLTISSNCRVIVCITLYTRRLVRYYTLCINLSPRDSFWFTARIDGHRLNFILVLVVLQLIPLVSRVKRTSRNLIGHFDSNFFTRFMLILSFSTCAVLLRSWGITLLSNMSITLSTIHTVNPSFHSISVVITAPSRSLGQS